MKKTFQYAVPERNRPLKLEAEVTRDKLESIRRQLQRRANMESSGFTKKIIRNEEMPEEVRRRFAVEKERLDQLAMAYPALAAEAEKFPVQRQANDDGELTPEFKDAAQMMKISGAWDALHQEYLMQLQRAARDETLPPEERPDQEFLDRVRTERLIPSL